MIATYMRAQAGLPEKLFLDFDLVQSLRYGDMESSIEQAFGMFSFDTNGPDAQEEALARMLQKKKKKKRRSRGLS